MNILLAVLACYRLTTLVVYDAGPFRVFKRLRAWLGTHDNGFIRENGGELVNCPYCVGIWMAVVAALLLEWPAAYPALLVLGIAGGQSLMQDIMGARNGAE